MKITWRLRVVDIHKPQAENTDEIHPRTEIDAQYPDDGYWQQCEDEIGSDVDDYRYKHWMVGFLRDTYNC
jgi:hypothetical protein